MSRLRAGIYRSNNGDRRLHIGVSADSDSPSLCGLYFMHWHGWLARSGDAETIVRLAESGKMMPYCRTCVRLAKKHRDAIVQLGDLV